MWKQVNICPFSDLLEVYGKVSESCESESLLFCETLLSMSEGNKNAFDFFRNQFLTLDTVDILGWVLPVTRGLCISGVLAISLAFVH